MGRFRDELFGRGETREAAKQARLQAKDANAVRYRERVDELRARTAEGDRQRALKAEGRRTARAARPSRVRRTRLQRLGDLAYVTTWVSLVVMLAAMLAFVGAVGWILWLLFAG